MKTKEKLNALMNKAKARLTKPAELSADELEAVTAGTNAGGVCGPDPSSAFDRLWTEFTNWLDMHPNATYQDILQKLNHLKAVYADELTADDLAYLDEILLLFAP